MNKTEKTYLSLYEKGRMSETQRAYFTIWLLYNDRLKLEKLPRTSKIEAKIEELRSLELQLKRAVTDPELCAPSRTIRCTGSHGTIRKA